MTDKQPELMQTMIGIMCPECHKEIVAGIGMYAPVAMFALTPAQLEAKKQAVLTAIAASTLGEPQKAALTEQYGDKHVMIDPSMADLMLQELTTTYGPKPPVPVDSVKPPKKSSGTKEPKA